jgi:rhodanese-related sulfurtransferase
MKSSFGTLDKRVPESKKYSHISSSLDTGASAKKIQPVSSNVAAKRRDEIFKRIKPSTLVRMLQEADVPESVYAMGGGSEAGDGRSASSVVASKAGRVAPTTVASVTSVAGSVLSLVETDTTVSEARDLVLLDLRERDEFDRCRLPTAVSYPAALINRDQFCPELHRCKREPSKLLVVYHTNEGTTIGVAKLLVEKGWENVHALTGGFEEIISSYPEVVDGEIPERPHTGGTVRAR